MSFDAHSTVSLPPLPILKKIKFFVRKNPSFAFSRILRQICYNLVTKTFQIQNRRASDISNIGHYQLASKREKCSR